jgi:hypothetical protein
MEYRQVAEQGGSISVRFWLWAVGGLLIKACRPRTAPLPGLSPAHRYSG